MEMEDRISELIFLAKALTLTIFTCTVAVMVVAFCNMSKKYVSIGEALSNQKKKKNVGEQDTSVWE